MMYGYGYGMGYGYYGLDWTYSYLLCTASTFVLAYSSSNEKEGLDRGK